MFRYFIIGFLIIILELLYFKIAGYYNIIDKPNERSSHSIIALRGGGIIFVIGTWVWSAFFGLQYPWFLAGVTLVGGVSFVDDILSLPDLVRLIVQFIAMGLMFYQLDIIHADLWWAVIIALIVCVGAINIYNFMDGINGITAGYSLSVLIPLLCLNIRSEFMETSFIIVTILSVLVFGYFNFRPKNKAMCFAGDVGSVGMAFILLFVIGCLVMNTKDITWLLFLVVYGVDGCCTIVHRIMLHENLGEAHRKHAYQLMVNELEMSHQVVSLIYLALQLVVSLVMVFWIPNTILAHWIYLIVVVIVLVGGYVLFMKKYYHLHEVYLESVRVK